VSQLSEHFTLEEFEESATAARRGIDNRVPSHLLPNALRTAEMLERVRAHLCGLAGREIHILVSSGYRCEALNAAVGGSPTSDHARALAADWTAPRFGTPTEICQALEPVLVSMGIGQLINEFPPSGWVHTGLSAPSNPNNRVLTIAAGRTRVGIHRT
jgi:hypothetical protein